MKWVFLRFSKAKIHVFLKASIALITISEFVLDEKMLQNLSYFWNQKTQIVFNFELFWICYSRCPGLCRHRTGHSMYLGFLIPKIWQILKHFSGPFRQVHTLKLLGMASVQKKNSIKTLIWLRGKQCGFPKLYFFQIFAHCKLQLSKN